MRHGVAGRKLNRSSSHRKAMLDNMVASLLEHERIQTTVPKAKEARRLAEHIITLGKKGGLHNIRLAERTIRDRVLLQKIFGELKERYASRPGGYTRIIRTGYRHGDAAEMAFLELVDRVEKPAKGDEEKGGSAKSEKSEE
jgi:large subunit ribosomal protein L17